jgi:hypothetical protein
MIASLYPFLETLSSHCVAGEDTRLSMNVEERLLYLLRRQGAPPVRTD